MYSISSVGYALPSNLMFDVKKFSRQVKTKKWVKKYAGFLGFTAERLTTEGVDTPKVILQMLTSAYGVNIGEQVLALLDTASIDKIKANVLAVYYS